MWRFLTFASSFSFFSATLVVLQAIWTDTDPFGFDCLSNFPVDSGSSPTIKYCIRPRQAQAVGQGEFVDQSHSELTFAELYSVNVTSLEILSWSSSIDLAEDYQEHIEQVSRSYLSKKSLFNCTPPWFGSHCQYALEMNPRSTATNDGMIQQTCYLLLECDRGHLSLCLDWREICDGRIDCLNGGVDELRCFELENQRV